MLQEIPEGLRRSVREAIPVSIPGSGIREIILGSILDRSIRESIPGSAPGKMPGTTPERVTGVRSRNGNFVKCGRERPERKS